MLAKVKLLIKKFRDKISFWNPNLLQPSKTGQKPFGSLGLLFESRDEIDAFILQEVTNPPILLNIETLCFTENKLQKDKYLQKVFDITSSLLKANENRRKYIETEKRTLREFLKKSSKDPNRHIDLTLNPVELNSEFDAFLSQTQATLDSLALTLNALLGLNLDGWRKAPKQGLKSGFEIIRQLKKYPNHINRRRYKFVNI
ncbi:hypothetical protein A3C73_00275 [Candidatus Giovannonibacteria bacterium RIFCSPHIGHO2_02_FULL_44_11]|nr:MAG: hypothetical protein A3C73_00275 [Candidatus Giovannonibacteria bacterium RIFCSPHIGHO2_02_FULL_44_11]